MTSKAKSAMTEKQAITAVARILANGALGTIASFKPEAERIIERLKRGGVKFAKEANPT